MRNAIRDRRQTKKSGKGGKSQGTFGDSGIRKEMATLHLKPLFQDLWNIALLIYERVVSYDLFKDQSTRTISLAFMLYELFPLELCQSQNHAHSVSQGQVQLNNMPSPITYCNRLKTNYFVAYCKHWSVPCALYDTKKGGDICVFKTNKKKRWFPAKGTSWHVHPSQDSDQPAHPCSLIRVFNGPSIGSQESSLSSSRKLKV